MPSSPAEFEAVGLAIAVEALDDIVNHSTLQVLSLDGPTYESEVRFQTHEHQQLFLIRLLDFVHEGGDPILTGVNGSCLDVLAQACATKSFEIGESAVPLSRAVAGFQEWLNEPTPLRLWLPTLDVNARLAVPRRELLFIAGNQSKHNLSRLTRVSRRVAKILREHEYDVQPELIPLALEELGTHLHEDYFVYYGTWLTEHLTGLRWGIQTYLSPMFERVYRPATDGGYAYSYDIPDIISAPMGKEWFWRLMNQVRRRPYLAPVHASRYLKAPVLRPEPEPTS